MKTPQNIVDALSDAYQSSVENLQADLKTFVETGRIPSPAARTEGRYAYPELRIIYQGNENIAQRSLSFGRLNKEGIYATTITRPRQFSDYLIHQLEILQGHYEFTAEVRASRQEIPFPYVLDGMKELDLGAITPIDLARYFPSTELADIGDEIADGTLVG